MRNVQERGTPQTLQDDMVKNSLALVDSRGQPLMRSSAHEAASRTSAELASWNVGTYSADAELLPELGTLRDRTHDMIRNHGIMSGAVQIHLDNVIGSGLRLNAKPDWRVLGVKQSDTTAEWERDTQAKFLNWANDIDCYCDAGRRLNFNGMIAQGYRSYLTSFEILATGEWLPSRGCRYATAIQLVDPMRLSNPNGEVNRDGLREGVELDTMGAPIAYHISSEATLSPFLNNALRTWKRVPRETSWGRKLVMHHYDVDRPSLSRGKGGVVSVLAKLKMLEKFEQATLQAAILNAMYAAVVESSMDWDSVGNALGADDNKGVLGYMNDRVDFHGGNNGGIRYNGVKIPHLYPGEKLNLLAPQHPTTAFASFEETSLRYLAAGLNLSYEQLSRDYSKTNYSSARAAMLEGWRFFNGRNTYIAAPFATNIYALWLEEAFDKGDVVSVDGAPGFYEMKSAWTRSKWIGPGRSHIDPEKDANASRIEYSLGLTTLEKEASERGEDWEDLLEQRAQEFKRMEQLGLDPQIFIQASVNAKPSGGADGGNQNNSEATNPKGTGDDKQDAAAA